MQQRSLQGTDEKLVTFPEELTNKEDAGRSVREFPAYLQRVKLIQDSGQTEESDNSLRVAVECENPEMLEQLWRDYRSGYLNVVAEKCLLTDDIKRRFHLTSVKFKTTILEEDYLACKDFLLNNTGGWRNVMEKYNLTINKFNMFNQSSDFVEAPNLMVLLMIISVIVTSSFIFGGNVFTALTSHFCFKGGFFRFYINLFIYTELLKQR